MSAWILGLALGAGYLINKNLQMSSGMLEKAENDYNKAAGPSTNGVTSSEIRSAWADTEYTKFGDMHERLAESQKVDLVSKTEKHREVVSAYDTPPGSDHDIRGVLMTFDRYGPS